MTGKQKCRILKEIRAEIAKQNDIGLVIEECTHKGECRGTCPRCESEVLYLEAELEKRRRLKKTVALAGVYAGMTVALSGCAVTEALMDSPISSILNHIARPTEPIDVLEGEVPYDYELMGDVAIMPDSTELTTPTPRPLPSPEMTGMPSPPPSPMPTPTPGETPDAR